MKSQPLTDAEFEQLRAILERLGDERRMNLERLDGFLAALICGPNLVRRVRIFQGFWEKILSLKIHRFCKSSCLFIMRHWNTIVDTLNSGEIYLPLLLEDENGISHANDWAIGFLHGMEFGKEDWAVLLDDEENGGLLIPIFALANEHNPDPSLRPYKK